MAAKSRRDDEVIVLTGKDKDSAVKLRMSCLPARSLLRISTLVAEAYTRSPVPAHKPARRHR